MNPLGLQVQLTSLEGKKTMGLEDGIPGRVTIKDKIRFTLQG